jgi:cytochrome c peroxidase
MIVCAFGMWCFIHGQRNVISLTRNELPEQIKSPATTVVEAAKGIKENIETNKSAKDYNIQLDNFFNYSGELPTDRETGEGE